MGGIFARGEDVVEQVVHGISNHGGSLCMKVRRVCVGLVMWKTTGRGEQRFPFFCSMTETLEWQYLSSWGWDGHYGSDK